MDQRLVTAIARISVEHPANAGDQLIEQVAELTDRSTEGSGGGLLQLRRLRVTHSARAPKVGQS